MLHPLNDELITQAPCPGEPETTLEALIAQLHELQERIRQEVQNNSDGGYCEFCGSGPQCAVCGRGNEIEEELR